MCLCLHNSLSKLLRAAGKPRLKSENIRGKTCDYKQMQRYGKFAYFAHCSVKPRFEPAQPKILARRGGCGGNTITSALWFYRYTLTALNLCQRVLPVCVSFPGCPAPHPNSCSGRVSWCHNIFKAQSECQKKESFVSPKKHGAVK